MARMVRRRRPAPRRRRQLEVVRRHEFLDLSTSNNAQTIDLLLDAEGSSIYQKDLTPSTVAGVKLQYSWFADAGSVETAQFMGIGLINESRRQTNALAAVSETEEAKMSPLDAEGRYMRWHLRRVHAVSAPGASGYLVSQQLADNRQFARVRSNRKLFTVDDTYYLMADLQGTGDGTIHLFYSVEIWLKKP